MANIQITIKRTTQMNVERQYITNLTTTLSFITTMEYGNQLDCNIQIMLTNQPQGYQPQGNQASNMNSKSQTQKKIKQKNKIRLTKVGHVPIKLNQVC